jgi:lysozyme
MIAALWRYLAALRRPRLDPAGDFLAPAGVPMGVKSADARASADHARAVRLGDARGGPVPEAAVALVKKWEGFRARPYRCPAGVPTIGYGSTYYADGRPVRTDDPPVTEADAEMLLRVKLDQFAGEVDRLVRVPLSASRRAALISFAYNVGTGALARSTLLAHLNAGLADLAAEQFIRWNRAGANVLPGLTARRAEEAALFRAG